MKQQLLFISLGLVGGVALSYGLYAQGTFLFKREQVEPAYFETREVGYQFIEPLLECDIDYRSERYTLLEEDIQIFLQKHKLEKEANVYFRDLHTGAWIGINEKARIAPASMTKVLLLVASYKEAQENPEILQETFTYDDRFDHMRNIEDVERRIQKGSTYTLQELVEKMVVYSDNEAAFAVRFLINRHNPTLIETLSKDLQINSDGTTTLFDYSNIFRLLYNATFLDKEYSSRALELLTHTEFQKGLAAGIPTDIVVAHKFGFYEPPPEIDDDLRFSHCGVVYQPGHPYLLCVSMPAKDYPQTQERASQTEELSRMVYQWVTNN